MDKITFQDELEHLHDADPDAIHAQLVKDAEAGVVNVAHCDEAMASLFAAIRYDRDLPAAYYWRAECYRIRVSSLPLWWVGALTTPLRRPLCAGPGPAMWGPSTEWSPRA
jgi:hypothetical protein